MPRRAYLPLLIAVLIAGSGGCRRGPAPIAIRATICGKLCGEPNRATDDFTGLECAASARIRILEAGSGGADAGTALRTLADRCVDFGPSSTNRLVDLFRTTTPGVEGGTVALSVDPSARVIVEVSLYAPAAAECPADKAPLLALGRSAAVDVATRAGGVIEVPLGCRKVCGGRNAIRVQFAHLESDVDFTVDELPADITLGEIYSYQPMVSTAGSCAAPPTTPPSGDFRRFEGTRTGDVFDVEFNYDRSPNAGCIAARVVYPEGVVYACLDDKMGTDARAWLPSPEHIAALVASSTSPHGMLVVSARDPTSFDPTAEAYLSFGGLSGEYVSDDTWSDLVPGGTRPTGIAVMRNVPIGAPTGTYALEFRSTITHQTLTTAHFTAGGADEPGSITTLFIVQP